MENKELIRYYYQTGVYSIEKVMEKVGRKIISKQDFYDITRKYYDVLKQKKKMGTH